MRVDLCDVQGNILRPYAMQEARFVFVQFDHGAAGRAWLAGLVDQVTTAIHDSGIAPHKLKLELTESLLAEGIEVTVAKMASLKAMGVTLSLDDFGMGYSSLSYLKRFPFDALKIDREFVRDVASDPDDRALVTAAIRMGKGLGLSVVAEGVETEQQLEQLRKMHCAYAQGYHLSRPVEAPQFETLIGTGRSWAA